MGCCGSVVVVVVASAVIGLSFSGRWLLEVAMIW